MSSRKKIHEALTGDGLMNSIENLKEYRNQISVGINRVAEQPRKYSYLATQKSRLLRPTRIYGLLNERCNCRCLMCGHWQNENKSEEMTADQWKRALGGLRDFVGPFHINFSGGEPFLRKDIYEIFEFLHERDCLFGVCTNGGPLSKKGARRLCEMRLLNYNTSLDGVQPETHNYLRGRKRAYDWVIRGIKNLRDAGRDVGYTPPIIVKPTVCKRNMRELVDIVKMAREEDWAAINFQPMGIWTEETKPGGELWIGDEDIREFEDIVEELIEMRNNGYPIWTTTGNLKKMVYHFKEKFPEERNRWCTVGMTNITIYSNGDIKFCDKFPSPGNVKDNSIKDIWFSDKGEKIRKKVTYCKKLCLENCRLEHSIKDQLMIFNIIRKGRR